MERTTLGSRRLKIDFRYTIKDDQESSLNLLWINTIGSISVEQTLQMFIKKIPRRLFSPSLVFSEIKKDQCNFYYKLGSIVLEIRIL